VAKHAETLLSSLKAAGWLTADRIDPHNMTRLFRQGLDYTTAPLAPAFWDGQVDDLALEKPVQRTGAKSIATLRLWQTAYRIGNGMLFVGIAREYVGIRWGLLHRISPDVDAATAFLVQSLKQTDRARDSCRAPLVKPMIGHYLLGGAFFTHGDLSLIDLTQGNERPLVCVGPCARNLSCAQIFRFAAPSMRRPDLTAGNAEIPARDIFEASPKKGVRVEWR
jgi:hypothetical protein